MPSAAASATRPTATATATPSRSAAAAAATAPTPTIRHGVEEGREGRSTIGPIGEVADRSEIWAASEGSSEQSRGSDERRVSVAALSCSRESCFRCSVFVVVCCECR